MSNIRFDRTGGVGFKIIAASRFKQVLYADCNICLIDENFKKGLHCEDPAQEAVWADEKNIFYNCPLRFVPSSVNDFVTRYNYNKKYNTNVDYNDQIARYIRAERILEHWMTEYTEQTRKLRR